jgi:Family of unknown function (DUF5752)
MATTAVNKPATRWARAPFFFNSAAHLLRIGRQKASTLAELLEALRTCPEDSIFQHTFRTLQEHHFLSEGFSNDFAHWAFSACNEVALAEQLAALDVRAFISVKAVRERIVAIVETYLKNNPRSADRAALEPFYFCAADTVVIPTPLVARNLREFADCLQKVSLHSIHYHYIEARLRLKLSTNDFSIWLEEELGLGQMADRLNRIDIYTSTLQDVRNTILRTVQVAIA